MFIIFILYKASLRGKGVRRDLNPHKLDSQSSALTNYATYTVAVGGIEPPTTSL